MASTVAIMVRGSGAGQIKPHTGVAVYRQLASIIRDQIATGRLRPGDKLLTQDTYVYEYGIGVDAVRDALAILRSEGLIDTTRQGSVVRRPPQRADVTLGPGMRAIVRMPTERERHDIGLPEGVPVVVFEKPGGEMEVLAGDRIALVGNHEQDAAGGRSG
uniref:GntR family transcriptional regulator n=1 Tax=Herbidospora sakaeratensis TaxID=564415 RepID=UPI001471053B|nr:winged helix-turn-helix domain-containing protein [Herbidospora sakaeratensis]